VRGNRLRWGALGWVLTLQFFVVEAVAAARYPGYTYGSRVISDLGSTASPLRPWMNSSFIVQAGLILAGAVFLLPALGTRAARVASVLLGLAAVGVLMVGAFPEDGGQHGLHVVGAVLYFLAGAVGLLALGYAVRPRSEALGSVLAVLGLIGLAGSVFYFDAITEYLGEGGTERVAAYVLPIGLALSGAVLAVLAGRDGTFAAVADRPSRREVRAEARAVEAERARQRDAALEAAAQRRAAPGTGTDEPAGAVAAPTSSSTGTTAEDDPDFDPEDPWAPTRRREN
jgi:hypothetical membrane protein